MKSYEINDPQFYSTKVEKPKVFDIKPYLFSYGLMLAIPVIKGIHNLIKSKVN
jgi:hypothetical protein